MTWWGSWAFAGAVVPDSFDIYFHQDTAGPFGQQPGTVLASFLGVTPSIAPTGLTFPSFAGPLPEFKLDLPLPTTVSLTPGVYWVQIVCTGSSGSGEEFVWEMAPEDPINGASCMAWSLDTPGLTWFSCTPFGETDMSLQLFEASGIRFGRHEPTDQFAPSPGHGCGWRRNLVDPRTTKCLWLNALYPGR